MGAAAEYKQQQVVAERIKIEDALRSEPLGPNSVALFMRLRQNLAKEAEGLGYSDDRLDAHVLENTSKLVNDLFNHYADSDRPEDALAFLQAVEVFEQSPMAAAQGPTSLRGKTYEEAKAAAAADKKPVGAVMFEGTREGLKRKAEKLSLDSWAISTAADFDSLGAGLDYSLDQFESGEISASQKDALDRRLIANQERKDKVKSIQGKKFYEEAKENFLDNGKITQDMEDKLREFDLYDDYLDFVSRKTPSSGSRGNAASTADAEKWGAWRAVNMNDKVMQRVARKIRVPDDLQEPYLEARRYGATPDQASKYAQDIAALAFAEEVDANEALSNMGYETPSAVRQSIGAYFDEQGQALRLQLGQEDPRTEGDVWDKLMDEQRGIFVSKVQDQINILVSEDSKKPPREVTQEAIATIWNSRRVPYREGGKDKVTNLWLETPAKAKAIQEMMAPGGGGKALQAYATDMRVVGAPDDERRQESYRDAAARRWAEKNPTSVIGYQRQQAERLQRALEVVNLRRPQSFGQGEMGALAMQQASRMMPTSVRAEPSPVELLEEVHKVIEEDRREMQTDQTSLFRQLWSEVNANVDTAKIIDEPGKGELRSRYQLRQSLRDMFEDSAKREYWARRGLTDDQYEAIFYTHPALISGQRIPGRRYEVIYERVDYDKALKFQTEAGVGSTYFPENRK